MWLITFSKVNYMQQYWRITHASVLNTGGFKLSFTVLRKTARIFTELFLIHILMKEYTISVEDSQKFLDIFPTASCFGKQMNRMTGFSGFSSLPARVGVLMEQIDISLSHRTFIPLCLPLPMSPLEVHFSGRELLKLRMEISHSRGT